MLNKNYGLEIVPIVIGENWIAGTELSIGAMKGPREILQLDGQWLHLLPTGERQYNKTVDLQGCVSWGFENAVEIVENRLYGSSKNYSDRFLAVASETKPTGNDPHRVGETFRNKGAPLEPEYPLTDDLDTWEKVYAPIPSSVFTLAEKFVAEYDFNHEYVPASPASLKEQLKFSPLPAAVYAWQQDENGLYYMPPGVHQNHYVVIVGYVEGKYWLIYDSYDVNTPGDFIKKVRWDMPFIMVKSISLKKKPVELPLTFWQWLPKFLTWLWGGKIGPMPPLPKEILP